MLLQDRPNPHSQVQADVHRLVRHVSHREADTRPKESVVAVEMVGAKSRIASTGQVYQGPALSDLNDRSQRSRVMKEPLP